METMIFSLPLQISENTHISQPSFSCAQGANKEPLPPLRPTADTRKRGGGTKDGPPHKYPSFAGTKVGRAKKHAVFGRLPLQHKICCVPVSEASFDFPAVLNHHGLRRGALRRAADCLHLVDYVQALRDLAENNVPPVQEVRLHRADEELVVTENVRFKEVREKKRVCDFRTPSWGQNRVRREEGN